MKRILSICAVALLAFAFSSCNSSSGNEKVQTYQFFLSQESSSSVIPIENVELKQLFDDLKKDVEIWAKTNAAAYSVEYETEAELEKYNKIAVDNFEVYQNKFKSWVAKEYADKLKNHDYYGEGYFKLVLKVYVQSIIGGTKDLAEPAEIVLEYEKEKESKV